MDENLRLSKQSKNTLKKKKRKMRQSPKTNTTQGLVELELATEHSVFTTGEGFNDPAFFLFVFLNIRQHYYSNSIECETKMLMRIKKYTINQ